MFTTNGLEGNQPYVTLLYDISLLSDPLTAGKMKAEVS